ncbi:MAG TPA: FAD-dependent oxidoreductase [Rhodospirillales bacterium]|nr:FAD-dependent oxidoreductase [Rhodospirillales bacterium]
MREEPTLRETNIARLDDGVFDVLVVGGGINGAVAAAALSGKGARVALIDRGDWGGFTSQESSNLAWGGIKYLESYDFRLVRKLCLSRNHLLRSFPSIVKEIRFYTGVPKGFRHGRLKLWAGAWLYWLMGNGFTRPPRLLSPETMRTEEPILDAERTVGGFEYSDAYLHDNDSRFVFTFVRSALNNGCIAANYVESLGARRGGGVWETQARDVVTGAAFAIRSRVLVNAAGPFVDAHNALTGQKTGHRHVFSKGVHLIVDRLTPNQRVLTLFASDGRLFFVIPMGARTCIGTTDTRVDGPVTAVSDEDRDFILANVNDRLKLPKPLTRADVIAERCGVRPLVVRGGDGDADGGGNGGGDGRDWLQLSRKHAVKVNRADAHVSIFGGKLTDCINVGDEVSRAAGALGVDLRFPDHRWYGEPAAQVRGEFEHQAKLMDLDALTAPTSTEPLTRRLWRRYGARAFLLLEDIRRDPRQAEILIEGTEYIRCELKETARREMVVTLEDFLRRRSKIALVVRREDIRRSPGLAEACAILFGPRAGERLEEYFAGEEREPAPPVRDETSFVAPV